MAETPRNAGGIGKIARNTIYNKGISLIGLGRLRDAPTHETHVRTWLKQEFKKNNGLASFLQTLEEFWGELHELRVKIIGQMEEAGVYADDPLRASREAELFWPKDGTGLTRSNSGDYTLHPKKMPHEGLEGEEDLYVFGKNIERLIDEWNGLVRSSNTKSAEAMELIKGMQGWLEEIKGVEDTYHKEVEGARKKIGGGGIKGSLSELRNRVLGIRNKYLKHIRFRHSYKVIKPYLLREKQPVTFKEVHPRFQKWSFEIEPGKDEYGYPLEIDDSGRVLLDVWMNEIAQNSLQQELIIQKYTKLGQREVGAQFVDKCREVSTIRTVDREFCTDGAYLDALEIVSYSIRELDALIDDVRDGRYHPHSKCAKDYGFHAEGGVDSGPFKMKTIRHPITVPITLTYDPTNGDGTFGYVHASPQAVYQASPPEEQQVSKAREYSIRSFTVGSGPIKGLRSPHDLSPAFDRMALGEREFLHWGRMLYYEGTEGINKWSENPYPCISTVGAAEYLLYFAVALTETYDMAIKTTAGIPFDIGPRKRGASLNFNPLEGIG